MTRKYLAVMVYLLAACYFVKRGDDLVINLWLPILEERKKIEAELEGRACRFGNAEVHTCLWKWIKGESKLSLVEA